MHDKGDYEHVAKRSKASAKPASDYGYLDPGSLMIAYVDLLLVLIVNIYYFFDALVVSKGDYLSLYLFRLIIRVTHVATWSTLIPTFKLSALRAMALLALFAFALAEAGAEEGDLGKAMMNKQWLGSRDAVRMGLTSVQLDFYRVLLYLLCCWLRWRISPLPTLVVGTILRVLPLWNAWSGYILRKPYESQNEDKMFETELLKSIFDRRTETEVVVDGIERGGSRFTFTPSLDNTIEFERRLKLNEMKTRGLVLGVEDTVQNQPFITQRHIRARKAMMRLPSPGSAN